MAEYRSVTAEAILQGLALQADAQIGGQAVQAAAELLTKVDLPGGLEYEAGTWTPSEDTMHGEILFQRQHEKAPFFAIVFRDDYSGEKIPGTIGVEIIVSFYDLYGEGVIYQRGSQIDYGYNTEYYYGSTQTNVVATTPLYKNPEDTSVEPDRFNVRFYLNNEKIMPYGNQPGQQQYWDYFRAGIRYKWIAVWAPKVAG